MSDASDFANRPETPNGILLGRKWLRTDEDGTVHVRFFAREEFVNRAGTIQGGFLCAMLDSVAAMSLIPHLQKGETLVTKTLETQFLKPGTVGEMVASAKLTSQDERGAVSEAELRNSEGIVVAKATALFRKLHRR